MENLLLDSAYNIKLTDFGFSAIASKKSSNTLFTCKGTPGYMAPEIFTGKGYSGEAVDVFALGVVLFAMLMGRPPFRTAELSDPYYRLICSN